MLDRDIVATAHEQEVIYGLFNSSNCDELGCMSRSFVACKLFQIGCFIDASEGFRDERAPTVSSNSSITAAVS